MNIESLADGAKRHILEWIAIGELKPGQQIKEEEIAQRLDISRPPIREAFKSLEAEGLVVRKPRRGVFVTEMTEKDVWEVYTLKATLYEMATALAIKSVTPHEIKKLNRLVQKMEAIVKKEPADLFHFQDIHRDFHIAIMDMAGNKRLKQFASSLHKQIRRFSFQTLQDKKHLHSSVQYHKKIVKAMADNDTKMACSLTKEHVLVALRLLLKIPVSKKGEIVEFSGSEKPCE